MDKWISVIDSPLFTKDENGYWTCTEDGEGEFMAAVPYKNKNKPNEELWWIRYCVIKDEIGLCVITDNDAEPAGWDMEDITHWMKIESPKQQGK